MVFECHVMGIPSPTVSWFREDQNIDNSPDYIITKINGTCCLKIRKLDKSHSAQYTCKATNPGGETQSSATLNVISKLNLLLHLTYSNHSGIYGDEGGGIKITCLFI